MIRRITRIAAVALACAVPLLASADELADKGRAVLENSKASVVTVRIVIKMQMSMPNFPSREEEIKSEATGTIIDPSGLTVMSLNETDPSGMFEDMMGSREGFEVKSSIGDLKILQDDGTEIAAQVVLRDRDLDLAFVRPTEAPKNPLPAIDLTKGATPGLLDPIVTITRLGRVASRKHAVSIERVSAIVERPRTFYVMGKDPTQTSLGSPALTIDGDAIGLCVMRRIKSGGDGGMSMFGGGDENMLAIVVPASDILEVAKQAPAAGEEAKEIGAEEPKEEKAEEAPKEGDAPKEDAPSEKPEGEAKPDAPAA
ncbi:MAG: trypsin-like peptidase domain-containing protein [Candidatus Hydrogenedentes bacterium]|nr:trypsin-like peptidase domain-containing protein [Candidatus Hydrogenedentota bacterium]